jgi:hypothetical protein
MLVLNQNFGEFHKIASLIIVVYAQLSAFIRAGVAQAESNTYKLDQINGNNSASSRGFWVALGADLNKIQLNFLYMYWVLNFFLLSIGIWGIFN